MLASEFSLLETIIKQSEHDSRRTIITLVEHNQAAKTLINDLRFYLPCKHTELIYFPDYETLAYETTKPNKQIIAERSKALFHLNYQKSSIIVTTPSALFTPIPEPSHIIDHCIDLSVDQELNITNFIDHLSQSYDIATEVSEVGQYARRGNMIDIYPNGSKLPCRIELDDDVIYSIRYFDPISQKSLKPCHNISIIPYQEILLNSQNKKRFDEQWKSMCFPTKHPYRTTMTQAKQSLGIHDYLPLFFEKTIYLFDQINRFDSIFISAIHPHKALDTLQAEYEHQYKANASLPMLEPERLLIQPQTLTKHLNDFSTSIGCWNHQAQHKPIEITLTKTTDSKPMDNLIDDLTNKQHAHVILSRDVYVKFKHWFATNNPIEIEDFSQWQSTRPTICYTNSDLKTPHWFQTDKVMVITEQCIQYQQNNILPTHKKHVDFDGSSHTLDNLDTIEPGQLLVHEDYGIGRFVALSTVKTSNDAISEYLVLEYQDGDKLYVPVYNLDQIRLYATTQDTQVELHHLNQKKWKKAKNNALKTTQDYAAQLLQAHAERSLQTTSAYKIGSSDYDQFCAEFPFEETNDQLRASQEIAHDLTQSKPMDRLLCADVSFGKTEVAMRASFITVHNQKQVIVLVPTTILANQHHTNFQKRFDSYPVHIACIHGNLSPKQRELILEKFEKNSIDILIGTHAIFSKSFNKTNTGLVVIDEEHRFGVKQKEAIKQLKTGCHTLMMSATPIPRTLNFALSYLHDISLMTSAPKERLPIVTFYGRYSQTIIQTAIHREHKRGGQIYYLHNNVSTITRKKEILSDLFPFLKIDIAHAQQPKQQLDKTMRQFYNHQIDLIVCSTIIESGIDVSNANTIIIERADKLGLAQLHQLRGRVGRSNHQGYAYLLTPEFGEITADAKKRLEAITQCNKLGSSFELAMQDLEIRGAGNILGTEQSGSINQIGFYMYNDLLKKACQTLDNTQSQPQNRCSCKLSINALIDETYLPDVHKRLLFYKKLTKAESHTEIDSIAIELIDRFGKITDNIQNLIAISKLKISASNVGIGHISGNQQSITLEFTQLDKADTQKLVGLIGKRAPIVQPLPNNRIKFYFKNSPMSILERISYITEFIKMIRSFETN